MNKNDVIRLRHMLDAALEAQTFAQNRSRADLATDRMLVLSLLKLIEIIGEAAANVSPESRTEIPGIPWPSIVGMRHRLVHGYYDVDLDRVWDTVIDDLPLLITALEQSLSGK
jgi:uncharacterized protein with HEPN domain